MRWPHYEHIFFDCDSTLTAVEGIDVLGDLLGKRQRVEILTQAAMEGAIDLHQVYGKRLQTLHPTRRQVLEISRSYKRNMVEDAARVVSVLQALGHKVYIISGGLAEPVVEFGLYLGVPRERIRAVDITYNELSGDWWKSSSGQNNRYLKHAEGALTVSDGKAQIVRELIGDQRGRALLIGDGHSDLLARHAVDLFVGYGGVISRAIVRESAPVYFECRSLAPTVALAGGPVALRLLRTWPMPYQTLGLKAQYLIQRGEIQFNDGQLEKKFRGAFLSPP